MRKSKAKSTPLDRLSANFLAALDQDFQAHGIEAIQKLREESPAKYSEVASRLILSTEPAEEDMSKATSHEDVARLELKAFGVTEPTKRQIAAVVKADAAHARRVEQIAGITPWEPPTYNGKPVCIGVEEI
jgi:hypothetical protein